MSKCSEQLSVTRTAVIANDVIVDGNGNLYVTSSNDEIDVLDAYDVWCVRHGPINHDMYADHGIDDYWEVVW
jgi:hypothetical protein